MSSGTGGTSHKSAQVNGNRNVVCFNRNDAKRNANLNNWDGDWPDNWRLLGATKPISPQNPSGEFSV